MEISRININGTEYNIVSDEQKQQIEELYYQLNHINEPYICGCKLTPDEIKSQNHCYTLKASQLKDWIAPDNRYFWYSSSSTTLYTEYGNELNSDSLCCYVLDCFKGYYDTDDEDDIITIYCGDGEY